MLSAFRPFAVAVALALALGALVDGQAPDAALDTRSRDILDRFFHSGTPPLVQYAGTRRLQARADRLKREGWMEVWTEFDKERGFRYGVVSEGGSGLIRSRVLREALEAERKAFAGESPRGDVTEANYSFAAGVDVEGGLIRFPIRPLRRHELLLDGSILVRADDGDLLEVMGRVSKNPSFWTRRVDVTRRYDRIGGVRVPVEMDSVANVLIAGRSTFTMSYAYRQINGQTIDSSPDTSHVVPTSTTAR